MIDGIDLGHIKRNRADQNKIPMKGQRPEQKDGI